MERDYSIIVELSKNGKDVVNSLSLDPDLDINGAVYGIKQTFEKGDADEATLILVSANGSDDDVLATIDTNSAEFEVKDLAARIEETLYGLPVEPIETPVEAEKELAHV